MCRYKDQEPNSSFKEEFVVNTTATTAATTTTTTTTTTNDNLSSPIPMSIPLPISIPSLNPELVDSIGDTLPIIKEGTKTKEYRCLRKAFLFFLVSLKLNIIQEATSTLYQFVHLYPTIVGWFYLVTKIKRFVFSFLDSYLAQEKDHIDLFMNCIKHSTTTLSSSSLSSSSPSQKRSPGDTRSNKFRTPLSNNLLCLEKRRILQSRESQIQQRINKLQCSNNNNNNDNNNEYNIQNSIQTMGSSNRRSSSWVDDSSFDQIYKTDTNESFTKSSSKDQQQHHSCDDEWGYFVDCKTNSSDEDERGFPLDMNTIDLCQVYSEDYGHFVDISIDSPNANAYTQHHNLKKTNVVSLHK